MKLLCNPTSYGNAKKLIDLHVDQICVGLDKLSNRSGCILSFEEIKDLVKYGKQNNVEVFALVNKNFFDPEIPFLTESLIKLINIDISGIIFADYSIPQILFENNLKTYLIYNPETLNSNKGQIDWFIENNINEISISREIIGREVLEIANNKKSVKIQMQICGYSWMMDSRWDLISNFKESHKLNQDLKFKKLFLKEANRTHPFIVYEDDTGTHMYTSYSLFLLDKLNELHDNGIDTIRIDSFLHDENWLLENVKFYQEAMKIANNKEKISDEFISNAKNELSKFDTLSHGFYMSSLEDLIYIPKKEYSAGYQTE